MGKGDHDVQGSAVYLNVHRLAYDWIRWTGVKTFRVLDFAGEVVANFFGLNQCKYQWILDAQGRDEKEKQQRQIEKRQRRLLRLQQLLETEERKLADFENGALT